MKVRKMLAMFIGLCLCGYFQSIAARPNVDLQVVKLINGFNNVHFDGLNYKTLIVVAHRENYNAHSYDVTTMYVDYKPTDKYEKPGLQIIPIIEKDEHNTLNLITSGGADCMLDDFRLVNNIKAHETWLILADRKFGQTFADTETVTFTYYKLAFDKDEIPGFPPFSFEYWKTVQAKQKYCDVNDAFIKELGLDPY
jgi:Carbapenem resistance protein CarG-like